MYEPSGTAGPSYGVQASEPLAPVLTIFAGTAPQRRLTVLVRLILAIPHLICLAALGIAAEVVAIIGWFGALFTGQLPDFAADFLGGYLHWQTRVSAYTALMTDQYPPFALGDAAYPVRIAFRPGRLNRLAVLFRVFLMIPAGIVAYVLQIGAFTIVGFVTWLIVLIKGGMPDSLYEAYAAVIRYMTRYWGFALMLTSAYPGRLFGDPPAPAPASAFAAEQGFATPEPPVAATEPPGTGTEPLVAAAEPPAAKTEPAVAETEPPTAATEPARTETEPALAAAEPPFADRGSAFDAPQPVFAAPQPVFAAAAQPSPWSLVLSSQARTLVGVFLGVGVLGVGGIVVGDVAVIGNSVATTVQVDDAYHTLRTQLTNEADAANACGNTDVSCATGVMGSVSNSYSTFSGALGGISMPGGSATSARDTVVQDARKLTSDYRQLAGVTSVAQFNSLAGSLGVSNDADKFRTDSVSLGQALGITIAS